ncbi:MAG TPA: hypothetical protein VN806_08195, partial [Caulobacteraceae bacterium]|nr:hypothetical protein [Caulobacteraceae bacterium]
MSLVRPGPARRGVLAGLIAAGLTACGRASRGQAAAFEAAPLKSVARFPVGCAAMTQRLADPAYADLLAAQFSQLTPEWEMKM